MYSIISIVLFSMSHFVPQLHGMAHVCQPFWITVAKSDPKQNKLSHSKCQACKYPVVGVVRVICCSSKFV